MAPLEVRRYSPGLEIPPTRTRSCDLLTGSATDNHQPGDSASPKKRKKTPMSQTSQTQLSHQRLIREQLATSEPSFRSSIETAVVKDISFTEAKAIITKYEWLGTMPAYVVRCYGIFFDGVCGGAVVYSSEYAENLGVWDKYGYTGAIICLSRGACVHWAHPHSASKLIRTSMRMLPERYKVVTCTVDSQAGEIGTIYQACGFDYVGRMRGSGNRVSIIGPDGKYKSERQVYREHGTRSFAKLRDLGLTINPVPRKARYFAFLGSKKDKRENRKAIEPLAKPYPKRALVGAHDWKRAA